MSKNKILTRVLPGFMELTPADQIVFDRMKRTIQGVYTSFGFVPLDTPVIERAGVLLAKAGGETEKQIYRFKKGDEELALRFDLTVPFARYVAEHYRDLVFPFRRSHIAKVYRGERPQKGRFREFYQCDIDIIGDGELSLMNDAEIPCVIYTIFRELDFGSFVIRINNRKLINGLMDELGIAKLSVEVMRIIDKIEKVGKCEIQKMLRDAGVPDEAISRIFEFLDVKGTPEEIIESLKSMGIENDVFKNGVEELSQVFEYIRVLDIPEEYFAVDLSIARGLDYYTGTVYETTLVDNPGIGSFCSGGRYDNLAEKYTDRKLPGVGISIGLTRLFSQLKDAGLIETESNTTTKVLIVPIDIDNDLSFALKTAKDLRQSGIPTEVYFENVKIAKKMKFADKIKVPYVIVIGEEEIKTSVLTFKNMTSGEQKKLSVEEIIDEIRKEKCQKIRTSC
jgi:histidyl-tRNA synthetase